MTPLSNIDQRLNSIQSVMLVILRVAVGWHFLYEGIAKMMTVGWTSQGYLEISKWIFAPVFHWIAHTPSVLAVVDFLNIWGLTLIGLGLMLGALTRVAAASGAGLLLLYYLANPPFIRYGFRSGDRGELSRRRQEFRRTDRARGDRGFPPPA